MKLLRDFFIILVILAVLLGLIYLLIPDLVSEMFQQGYGILAVSLLIILLIILAIPRGSGRR